MADTLGTEGAIQPGDVTVDETAAGGVEVTVSESDLAEGETTYTYDATDEAPEAGYTAPRPIIDGSIRGTGRRKEAVVRVRLTAGTGQWKLNGRSLEDYFPNKVHQQAVNEPFRVLEREGAYDVIALLSGGGISGQAGALRLGIARALIAIDENDRPALKRAGFLTRDARVKERKKYGLKKARKAPQYSKR